MDRQHEQFVCSICIEFAIDPVVMNDCDHIFCKECAVPWIGDACALCNQNLLDPKCFPIKGSIKRIYLDLKMRCLNLQCNVVLEVTNFKDHDDNCPITFDICTECGLKSRRNPPSYHSCVQVLKTELDKTKRKLIAVEEVVEVGNTSSFRSTWTIRIKLSKFLNYETSPCLIYYILFLTCVNITDVNLFTQ